MKAPEQRTIDIDPDSMDSRGRKVIGYAATFDKLSEDLGGFRERIAPGAFRDVVGGDVHALLNHDASQVLGRTKSGTLRLEEDQRGLRFELDLPASPIGDNMKEAVGRGDISGASFKFLVGSETWDSDIRTIQSVAELHEISLATNPAYPDTSIELRTRPEPNPERNTMNEVATEPEAVEETEERTAPALSTATLDQTSESRSIGEQVSEALLSTRPGEVRALTNAVSLSPGELNPYLFDKLRPNSVALQAGVQVISTDRDSVTFPRLTADVAPAWYAEAADITPGDPTLNQLVATPKKLAALTGFSNEVIDDSNPSALQVVQDNLAARLALGIDQGILEGTGSGNQPTGLATLSGVSTTTGVGVPTDLDVFADAIGKLETENAQARAIFLHPSVWAVVRKLKDGNDRYLLAEDPTSDAAGRVFGIPVFTSSQIKADRGAGNDQSFGYVVDTSHVYLVRRSEVTIELDRSRLFNSDQSELRGKVRVDVAVPNPKAVTRLEGVKSA